MLNSISKKELQRSDDGLSKSFNVVAARRFRSMKLPYTVPLSIGMNNCVQAAKPLRFVTSHSGQLSLLPSAEREMSTSQRGVRACMVHSSCGQTCACQVNLCDPSLTRVIPERFRGESLLIKRYTSRQFTYTCSYLACWSAVDDVVCS